MLHGGKAHLAGGGLEVHVDREVLHVRRRAVARDGGRGHVARAGAHVQGDRAVGHGHGPPVGAREPGQAVGPVGGPDPQRLGRPGGLGGPDVQAQPAGQAVAASELAAPVQVVGVVVLARHLEGHLGPEAVVSVGPGAPEGPRHPRRDGVVHALARHGHGLVAEDADRGLARPAPVGAVAVLVQVVGDAGGGGGGGRVRARVEVGVPDLAVAEGGLLVGPVAGPDLDLYLVLGDLHDVGVHAHPRPDLARRDEGPSPGELVGVLELLFGHVLTSWRSAPCG